MITPPYDLGQAEKWDSACLPKGREKGRDMTLKDIEELPKELLLMEDVAPFLEANPQSLRDQAQHDPNKLGFPVIVIGARVKTPKAAFVHFMKYGRTAP